MKYIFIATSVFLLNVILLSAQEKRLISYDFATGEIDTLDYVDYDRNILSDNTDFYVGNYSKSFMSLDMNTPQDHLPHPDAEFTYKQRASDYFDLTEFPIRTAVQLMQQANGELRQICSGSLVSPKHVLTACHCVLNLDNGAFRSDTMFVAPVLDDGELSSNFKKSKVCKVYKLDHHWRSDDLALLELSEPIGSQTGWLGLGFDREDKIFEDGIFYKFSYPGVYRPEWDSRVYTGDTLFFNYGRPSYVAENRISFKFHDGIPGESGSSIILIRNNEVYTTYGVLSFSNGLEHARIKNYSFYAIKSIIDPYINDLNFRENQWEVKANFDFMTNILSYELPTEKDIRIQVFNLQGIKQYDRSIDKTVFGEVDLSSLKSGVHLLFITSDSAQYASKIMKH